jgi:hypothetical protein
LLHALVFRHVRLPDASAAEPFRAASGEDTPLLRGLTIVSADVAPAVVRALAASLCIFSF